ncbi:MAG: hypothetical protein SGCHY_005511, partial [Lobulomycetales sp.]
MSRCEKLINEGRIGHALKALKSSGIATLTPEVIETLKRKHPDKPLPEGINDAPAGY